MDTIYSDSDFRDAFLYGAARCFFVCAYADFVEDSEREDDGYDYPRPGGGEDWFDFAPETTPLNAYALAGELWGGLNPGAYIAAHRAEAVDGVEPDPEKMGHYFAMQAMGHGVSWFDDHAEFEIELPDMSDVGFHSFDPSAYRE